jgi:hypothetical protein
MSMPYDALDAEREKRMAARQPKDPETFYFKCPYPGCEWRSHDFDGSYWNKRYRLDRVEDYRRHYTNDHFPVPLPEYVRNDSAI